MLWKRLLVRIYMFYLRLVQMQIFSSEELSFEGLLEVVVAGAGQGKINPRYAKTVEKLMENTDVSVSCYHMGGQSMSVPQLIWKI